MTRQHSCFPVGIVVFLFVANCAEAAKPAWQAKLEEFLVGNYEISKISLDSTRITKEGTQLVIRKDNVGADTAGSMTFWKNQVIDGKVKQGPGTAYVFKPGEKVYVQRLSVSDTEVRFFLISAEMYDITVRGTTQRTRYQCYLGFEFPKGTLETTDPAEVKKLIDGVIATEATANAKTTGTVALGQTPEQVEAIMGKPDNIANLGAKVTYFYKTMKVIFQDGKVADVQ